MSWRRLPPAARKSGTLSPLANDTGGVQIRAQPLIEVVADGDFAQLAAFLAEAQGAMFAEVLEVGEAQARGRADARPGVGEHPEHPAIAQADHLAGINRPHCSHQARKRVTART